jgi:hypothetical protein
MPTTPVPASQCGSLSGFELRITTDREWIPLGMPSLGEGGRSVLLRLPAAASRLLAASRNASKHCQVQIRYLWADWPVPTVYDARRYSGRHSELPVPPFVANVTVGPLVGQVDE